MHLLNRKTINALQVIRECRGPINGHVMMVVVGSLSEANLYHCVGFIGEGEKGGREVPWYNGDKNRIWKMFIDRKTMHLKKEREFKGHSVG